MAQGPWLEPPQGAVHRIQKSGRMPQEPDKALRVFVQTSLSLGRHSDLAQGVDLRHRAPGHLRAGDVEGRGSEWEPGAAMEWGQACQDF